MGEEFKISRTYPALIKRSRGSSGIVRSTARLPTSFKKANSSGVSRALWKNARDFDFSFAILSSARALAIGTTGYPA